MPVCIQVNGRHIAKMGTCWRVIILINIVSGKGSVGVVPARIIHSLNIKRRENVPSLEWNRSVWDKDYTWPADGDEWTQQAEFCGVPYQKWKDSLAEAFIISNTKPDTVALEIGAGHGRWSPYLANRVVNGHLNLVDLSSSCIEFCKKKLSNFKNVSYFSNDGRSLPFIKSDSIDFVWSFDTFVHIEEPEVRSYTRELFRVLKRQGMGIIHHSGNPTPEQKRNGARTQLTGDKFREILQSNGFYVIMQVDSWGDKCNLKMAGDTMTVFVRP